jgi:hypothetical protein
MSSARDLGLALGPGHSPHLEREGQVLGHAHVREQRVVLEHHADAALVRRHVVDVAPPEADLAMGGLLEPCEHHQAGGLAGPGRPQHGQELALRDGQVEVLHDQRLAVIALLHPVELNEGRVALSHGHPCALPILGRSPALSQGPG